MTGGHYTVISIGAGSGEKLGPSGTLQYHPRAPAGPKPPIATLPSHRQMEFSMLLRTVPKALSVLLPKTDHKERKYVMSTNMLH